MEFRPGMLIPVFILGLFLVVKFGCNMGIEYSDGTQSPVVEVELPQPKAPSRVMGIGEAMSKGQDVLLFRQTRKSSSLRFNERNFYFISKLMESYAPKVKVIELPNSVTYPQGDYYSDIMDNFPGNGYGVIKKEGDGYKLYKSSFGYSEEFETFVLPVKDSIEQVLGPSTFDKEKMISKQSKYDGYTRAMREGRNMILYSFADACNSLPPAQQKSIEKTIRSTFSAEAEIIQVDPKAYLDPVNELYSKSNNIVCVYNKHTKKTYPALYSGNDTMANIRKFLAER